MGDLLPACERGSEERNWIMPQLQLPVLPAGLTPITNGIGFQREEGKVV